MPPQIQIDKNFISRANDILNRDRYKQHNLITEEEPEYDVTDDDGNIAKGLNLQINAVANTLTRRIEQNTLISPNRWDPTEKKFHIVESDLNPILCNLEAVCSSCYEIIGSVYYSVDASERGRASLSILEGGVDHGTNDTETTGDYCYRCTNCDEEIDEQEVEYFIPQESLNNLKQMIRQFLQNNGEINTEGITEEQRQERPAVGTWIPHFLRPDVQPGQRIRQERVTNEFPDGKQIQHDIQNHGRPGPTMRQTQKGTRESYQEDFVFRSNWDCKHCNYSNGGQNKKCGNKECQKDKFTPTKDISLK